VYAGGMGVLKILSEEGREREGRKKVREGKGEGH
jgi:hypothetical protein